MKQDLGRAEEFPPVAILGVFRSRPPHRPAFNVVCAVMAGATLLVALIDPGLAQGKLDAQYEASLAGLVVGKGSWAIEIADDQYTAVAKGGTTGLLKVVSGGQGSGTSQGRMVNGSLVPAAYSAMTVTDKKNEIIRIMLAGGNVRDFSIEPEPPPVPERIPVTDAHRRGVIDPMTGSLVRVAGTGDPVGPEACRTGAAVFDGRMRYDLRLDYKRMEVVKAAKGYHGPAVVCAVYFSPVAGYVPDRSAIKYIAAQRNMEVWMAPISGTRVLAPFKVMIPTPFGMAALEATHFVTSTLPPRAAAKTQ